MKFNLCYEPFYKPRVNQFLHNPKTEDSETYIESPFIQLQNPNQMSDCRLISSHVTE